MCAILSRIILVSTLFSFSAYGSPLPGIWSRSLTLGTIDPSSDAWADTIAGIGPLILLVGEQSTKQLLCTIRGVTNAFSLAAAPLGLLTVVTSVLRLCGPERLRAFIGHDLEARTAAAVEMTRVNCGGVDAKLVNGFLVRNTNSHPISTAVAISKIQGDFGLLKTEVMRQVKECEIYRARKRSRGIPDDVAQVKWCLQITTINATAQEIMEITKTLATVTGINRQDKSFRCFQNHFSGYYRSSLNSTVGSAKITYFLTFSAVSEFATATPASEMGVFLQGFLATTSIMVIYFLALWRLEWKPNLGWILAFLGYVGISLGVICASLIISSSCENITLKTRSSNCKHWVDGVVFAVMNPDSMDTTGNMLWSTQTRRPQSFEAVWRKELTARRSQLSTATAILLVMAYICHFLGLRSSHWWVSTGELLVCILAAFARSMSKDTQEKFSVLEGVKVDRRCLSTGIISVQTVERIAPSLRLPGSVDIRAYSLQPAINGPTDGECVAWHIARQHCKDNKLQQWLTELTGLFVEVIVDLQDAEKRAVLVSFTGGILVEEGLAYPDARIGIAFPCRSSDLAAPTSLLCRGIMRQERWMVKHEELKAGSIPLGGIYIFSMNSMINWWTMAEDRNDMGDFQKQLNWPMLLVNIAFFMALLTGSGDSALVGGISNIHAIASSEQEMAEKIISPTGNVTVPALPGPTLEDICGKDVIPKASEDSTQCAYKVYNGIVDVYGVMNSQLAYNRATKAFMRTVNFQLGHEDWVAEAKAERFELKGRLAGLGLGERDLTGNKRKRGAERFTEIDALMGDSTDAELFKAPVASSSSSGEKGKASAYAPAYTRSQAAVVSAQHSNTA